MGSTSNACKEICDGTRNFYRRGIHGKGVPLQHRRGRSGAAGFNAADRLWQLGQHDIVLVTENRAGGTSRNTGSDKQTTTS